VGIFADMHLHRSNEYLGQVQGVNLCANDAVSSGNAVADLPRHPKKYGGLRVHELPMGGLNQTFSRPEKHPSSSLLPVSDDAVGKRGYVRNEAISMVESVIFHSYIDMYPCSSQPHIPSQSIVLRFYDLSGFSRSDSRFERNVPRINYMQRVNDTWNEFAMPRLSNDRTNWTIMFSHCRELIRFLPNCFLPPINYGASVS
jgi:hypothetical protein